MARKTKGLLCRDRGTNQRDITFWPGAKEGVITLLDDGLWSMTAGRTYYVWSAREFRQCHPDIRPPRKGHCVHMELNLSGDQADRR